MLPNVACGGCGASHFLVAAADELPPADIYVVDLTVNMLWGGGPIEPLLQRLIRPVPPRTASPAVLVLETFMTCGSAPNAEQWCNAAGCLDELERYNGPEGRFCDRWWYLPEGETAAAQRYNLPVASYRSAVWPVMRRPPPPPDFGNFWTGGVHPAAISHEMVADVVKHAFLALALTRAGGDRSSVVDTTAPCPHDDFSPGSTPMAKGDAPTSCNDKEGKATGWHPADANPCALRSDSVAYRPGRFEPARVDGSAWSFF